MPKVNLLLNKPETGGETSRFSLELGNTPLAEAVVAALQQPDLEALQDRWSGEVFYIMLGESFVMPDVEEGTETQTEFILGDVFFCNGRLNIAYGFMEMYDGKIYPDGILIGRVTESELSYLENVGNSIHRRGVREVSLA